MRLLKTCTILLLIALTACASTPEHPVGYSKLIFKPDARVQCTHKYDRSITFFYSMEIIVITVPHPFNASEPPMNIYKIVSESGMVTLGDAEYENYGCQYVK